MQPLVRVVDEPHHRPCKGLQLRFPEAVVRSRSALTKDGEASAQIVTGQNLVLNAGDETKTWPPKDLLPWITGM